MYHIPDITESIILLLTAMRTVGTKVNTEIALDLYIKMNLDILILEIKIRIIMLIKIQTIFRDEKGSGSNADDVAIEQFQSSPTS